MIYTFIHSFYHQNSLSLKVEENRSFNRNNNRRQPEPYRINQLIKEKEVRLVGDNIEAGIYSIEDALSMAREQNLDLVEISNKATPTICKIIDYSKFKYEQKKKQKELKAKTQKSVVKEIRFGPNTSEHDFNFKLKHAINFLEEGAKIKAYVQFVGRAIVYKERGEALLLKFLKELDEYGKVEQLPKLEGKRMLVMISPKATSGSSSSSKKKES